MALTAGNDLWSLSGQPNRFIPEGTKTGTSTSGGQEAVRTTKSESASSAVDKRNTPQATLDALQQLINQLSDRPNLSNEDVFAQFPDPVRNPRATSNSNYFVDPKTGYTMDYPEAQQLKARRAVERQKAQTASGTIEGGTIATKQQQKNVQTEISRNREQQTKYSKEAAFTDASQLTGRFSRQLLEQLMPQITQAVESSGTSGGAISGILAQDAAARVAEAQAALGLQASAQYGQIFNQLAAILEQLSTSADPTIQALLQALNISKGTIEQGVSSQTSTGTSESVGTSSKTTDTSETAVGNPLLQQLQQLLRPGLAYSPPVNTQGQPSYIEITANKPNLGGSLTTPSDERLKGLIL